MLVLGDAADEAVFLGERGYDVTLDAGAFRFGRAREDVRACFNMITTHAARLMRLQEYGVEVGNAADLVVLDCPDPETAIAELAAPLYGFKRGRQTFTRERAVLHRPR